MFNIKQQPNTHTKKLYIDEWSFDIRIGTINYNNKVVQLKPLQHKLLLHFVCNAGI